MESPNQVDINPSKTDLEVQAIAEITIENEIVKIQILVIHLQKMLPLLWKENMKI